jgi:hypothetical protein
MTILMTGEDGRFDIAIIVLPTGSQFGPIGVLMGILLLNPPDRAV